MLGIINVGSVFLCIEVHMRSRSLVATLFSVGLLYAQQSSQVPPPTPGTLPDNNQSHVVPKRDVGNANQPTPAPMSVHDKWNNFVGETVNPITVGGGIFNAGVSHLTNTDPKYGTNSIAFAQRFGASVADIVTQNFFGDFMLASAFHEDPRYFRKGPPYGLWTRIGYAISRAVIIRTDNGGTSFNWSNVLGTAMSAGLSNAYYPPASRTTGSFCNHLISGVLGAGASNLAPEFWPDFKRKVLKRDH